MDQKLCSRCKTRKPAEAFARNSAKKDGRQQHCRECKSKIDAAYYKENPGRIRDGKKRSVERAKKMVEDFLRKSKCVVCGNDDWVVLEFDHLGDKLYDVSTMVQDGLGLETIMREIEKCEVVCANCHRRRTYQRGKTWRLGR
jgi:hypothetical protein